MTNATVPICAPPSSGGFYKCQHFEKALNAGNGDCPDYDTWWSSICDALATQMQTTLGGARGAGPSLMQLNEPRGLGQDNQGNIVVSDYQNNRILMLTPTAWESGLPAELVAGKTGNPAHWFNDTIHVNHPADVSISGCRDAYVADENMHRIILFRPGYPDGIIAVGDEINGTHNNQLDGPKGVMVYVDARSATIYIADTRNNRVSRFPQTPPHGAYSFDKWLIGDKYAIGGSALTQLNAPEDVFVDGNLHVYIADTGNDRILKVPAQANLQDVGKCSSIGGCVACQGDCDVDADCNGAHLACFQRDNVAANAVPRCEIGGAGDIPTIDYCYETTGIGELVGTCSRPVSVHVDSSQNIYAACTGNHCVKRWEYDETTKNYSTPPVTMAGFCDSPVTAPLETNATYGSSLTGLKSPKGVYVDAFGSVYVSDTGNSRILKFGRQPLTQWIVRNALPIETGFRFEMIEYYTDLNCSQAGNMTRFFSNTGANYLSDWNAPCIGGCGKLTQWVGGVFGGPEGIRCVRVRIAHRVEKQGVATGMAINIAYWTGLAFNNYYEFGNIQPYVNTTLRLPRFEPYFNVSCIKGAVICRIQGLSGDWKNNGDKVMVKNNDCDGACVFVPRFTMIDSFDVV
jgi:DNA-binding beta-propeller fold protein YncE